MSGHDTSPPAYPDDKKQDIHNGHGTADPEFGVASSGRAQWFGGKDVVVGRRIGPVLSSLSTTVTEDSDDSSSAILNKQKAAEASASIQYRTCSWQKTAMLLFSEYICLAIMSFPWSYSILGLVPGYVPFLLIISSRLCDPANLSSSLIFTVVVAGLVLYT